MNQADLEQVRYEEFKKNLLPIGSRVRFVNRGHGSGTIIAYFITAIGEDGKEAIVSQDFPYRVRFDISHVPNVKQNHPKGYEAVFRAESIIALDPQESIFIGDARIMGRMWMEHMQQWTPWEVISDERFAKMQKDAKAKHNWEFCIR